nr:hypothetical protein [Tanacetum cinerariifolium]
MNTEIIEERSKKTQAEVTEGSSKRGGDKLEQESAKRQRLEKEDDYAELRKCLEVVPDDEDDCLMELSIKKLEDSKDEHQVYRRIVGIKSLHDVTTAQLLLLMYKVTTVFNKVYAASSRVTTVDRVTTAGWIKTKIA